MSFPYKHVLLVGATAGIGRAMADRFAETGLKVTAVGRRQERLDEFVNKYGADRASGVAFDISDIPRISEFAERYVQARYGIHRLPQLLTFRQCAQGASRYRLSFPERGHPEHL